MGGGRTVKSSIKSERTYENSVSRNRGCGFTFCGAIARPEAVLMLCVSVRDHGALFLGQWSLG